jgi:CheY-like chemotaxis protein
VPWRLMIHHAPPTRPISRSAITLSTDAVGIAHSGRGVTARFAPPGWPAIRLHEHNQFRTMQPRADSPGRRQAPRPDPILLDLNFPKLDGPEVLALIKEDNTLKPIPAVVLTASVAEVDSVNSHQLHANGYLIKPVQLDVFESLVTSTNEFWLEKAKVPQRG